MAQSNKEDFKEVFKKADKAGTGRLNFSHLKFVMLSMETEEQKKERDLDQIAYLIMKPANISGEKIIDYDELVKFIYDDEADLKEKMRKALLL